MFSNMHIRLMFKSAVQLSSRSFPVLRDTLHGIKLLPGKSGPLLSQLKKLNEIAYDGGGIKGRDLHVKKNKKILPRERLEALLDDKNDFLEIGLTSGIDMEYGDVPASGFISVISKVEGKYCVIISTDTTVKSGAVYPITVTKSLRISDMASANMLPRIFIFDSAGAFLPLQSEVFPDKMHGGRGFYMEAVLVSAGIPHVSMIAGLCTAGAAYGPVMCEDTAIVDGLGCMFLAGPPLVKAATGEDISAEELGGATMHCCTSGCTDYFAKDEKEAFQMVRDVIATVPVSNCEEKPSYIGPLYDSAILDELCGYEKIDRPLMYGIIGRLIDGSQFREFQTNYGSNLITGYGQVEGCIVGILANCGSLTCNDAKKGSHFIQNCVRRSVPLVILQNSGPLEEYNDIMNRLDSLVKGITLKARGCMAAAMSCAALPKIVVNIGNCHGDDNYTMRSKHGFLPESCWTMASRVVVDGIIFPRDTRRVLAMCLDICLQKERLKVNDKHFPVYRM